MSNTRIFCWGFVAFGFVDAIMTFCGVPHTYTGISDVIARFFTGASVGIGVVAWIGDLKPKEPSA